MRILIFLFVTLTIAVGLFFLGHSLLPLTLSPPADGAWTPDFWFGGIVMLWIASLLGATTGLISLYPKADTSARRGQRQSRRQPSKSQRRDTHNQRRRTKNAEHSTREHGEIIKYNQDRAFGFIEVAEGAEQLFFHKSNLVDNCRTKPGTWVSFTRIETAKGEQAQDVTEEATEEMR